MNPDGSAAMTGPQNPVVVDQGIAQYKDYEIEIEDQHNFVMKDRTDETKAIQITMRDDGQGGYEWIGLPECFKRELSVFRQEEINEYPGTLLKVILGQLYQPKQALQDSGEISQQITRAANIK